MSTVWTILGVAGLLGLVWAAFRGLRNAQDGGRGYGDTGGSDGIWLPGGGWTFDAGNDGCDGGGGDGGCGGGE